MSAGAAHDLLSASGWTGDADTVALRGLVLNLLQAITVSGDVVDGDDILTAQLHVDRSYLLARLGHALAAVPERLLRQVPDDAEVSVAATIGSFDELLRIVADLAEEGLEPMAALGIDPPQLSRLLHRAVASFSGPPGLRPQDALTGEMIALRMPTPSGPVGRDTGHWLLALPVVDEALADTYFEGAMTTLLGTAWAQGAIYDGSDAPPLHIVREAQLWSEPEGSSTTSTQGFVWRVADGWLVIGSTEEQLDTFEPHDPGLLAGPTQLARQRGVRSLPRDSPIVILASPKQLARVVDSHWSDVLLAPLADSFYAAMTVDVEASSLTLRSNVGVWSALVALTSTDRLAVDALLLSDLSSECVRAYLALCASRAVGPICEAFQPGRKEALASICGRLDP